MRDKRCLSCEHSVGGAPALDIRCGLAISRQVFDFKDDRQTSGIGRRWLWHGDCSESRAACDE